MTRPCLVENECARIGRAFDPARGVEASHRPVGIEISKHCRIVFAGTQNLLGDRVQNPVRLDSCGIHIGQKRKGDAPPTAEFGEDVRWVVADGRDSDALGLKFIYSILQLDQLRFAIGSPVRRTVEN